MAASRSRAERGTGQTNRNWKLRKLLAASGRGTREELGVPVADKRSRLKDRCRNADRNHHDGCSDDRNRGGGVHGDAQRAMVGSGLRWMKMGYLDDRKDGQKNKAENSHHRQSTRLSAAFLAELWLESCQSTDPRLKDTQNWTRRRWRWLRGSLVLNAKTKPTPAVLIRLNCVR